MSLTPISAQAVTSLGVFVRDYGSADGKVDPGTGAFTFSNYIEVRDTRRALDFDSFDINGLLALNSSSFENFIFKFTLDYTNADPGPFASETWFAAIRGAEPLTTSDDVFVRMQDRSSPLTIEISALSDGFGRNAFQHTLDSGLFEFGFVESTGSIDQFDLYEARLEVLATEIVVPTPLALPLFASAFGVAALVRRRVRPKA